MRTINCNWDITVGCEGCKYQKDCSLIIPSTDNLITIQKEIQWKLQRMDELSNAIVTMKRNVRAIEQGLVSQDRISIPECEDIIGQYQLEKRVLVSDIRDLRKREHNIEKILQRRMA